LERRDFPFLVGAILAGGVLGPVLLLVGLQRTPAATASLVLNFEVVATALVALLFFGERVGREAWAAMVAVTAGSALLTISPQGTWGVSVGAVLILGACLAWGLENNLTGRISLKDPKMIVTVKGLAAGGFTLGMALALGRPLPALGLALSGLALGAVSYGASIFFYVYSLRRVGAARTGMLFGTAPFGGAILSLAIFREAPDVRFFLAFALMTLAMVLLARERHAHAHTHDGLPHTHRHRHDDGHHVHVHLDTAPQGAHAHEHAHAGEAHAHPHRPDPHHRHRH
jgi:drug/metabolite transporter (DMT)-like permease